MARVVDRDVKRLKIVEAAAARFARFGYEATAMDDVASAASVSKGSLYDYFKDKEDLFYAVFEWLQQTLMRASSEQAQHGTTARERIIGFAEASIVAFVEHIELYPVTLEVWAAAAKKETRRRFGSAMRNLYGAYRPAVAALIDAAKAAGEIRADVDSVVLASMLIGAVDGLLLQYWLEPNFDPKQWTRTFLAALFEGVATKEWRN